MAMHVQHAEHEPDLQQPGLTSLVSGIISDAQALIKQQLTLWIDADVIAWFKAHNEGRGYQTEINRVLRRHVAGSDKRASRR